MAFFQFIDHLLWRQSARRQNHQQMIGKVGQFAQQLVVAARKCRDHSLDTFFAKLARRARRGDVRQAALRLRQRVVARERPRGRGERALGGDGRVLDRAREQSAHETVAVLAIRRSAPAVASRLSRRAL